MADYYFIKHVDGMAVVQYTTFSGVSKNFIAINHGSRTSFTGVL